MATVPPYLAKNRTGLTPSRPQGAQPQTAQQSVDQARQRMQQVGAGYTGSVWSAPGSYTAARPAGAAPSGGAGAPVGTAAQPSPNPTAPVRTTPLTPAGPGPAPGRGGIDVRSYTGSMYSRGGAMPNPGYQPQPSAEAAADRALKARFGPPPNERGQIDLSIDPRSRPVAPAQQTEAANPLTGTASTQMEGTSAPINAGKAMGFTQRGAGVPRGNDASGGANVGGTGLYARRFATPQSAAMYSDYVKRLFGEGQ